MPNPTADAWLEAVEGGEIHPCYLFVGDRVLTEAAVSRLGEAIAKTRGGALQMVRRPSELTHVLTDLRTFSMFGGGKTIAVVDSTVVADRSSAADLIDEAAETDVEADAELSDREREAAGRLLQALRLFELDPEAGTAAEALAALPEWAFQGGQAYRKRSRNRARPKGKVQKIRDGLTALLEAARAHGLRGVPAGDVSDLADLVRKSMPPDHTLLLAEATVAAEHPIVQQLKERGCVLHLGAVEAERDGGWSGLRPLAEELARETGVRLDGRAASELARRTLQRQGGRAASARADSTARFAAEYRKLAALAADGTIDADLVEHNVEDRGEEDVWKVLDAIGAGRSEQALERVERLIAASEDPIGTRLSLFGLLASFSRQLVAIGGMLDRLGGRRSGRPETRYNRFKSEIAPRLQEPLPYGGSNPLQGVHPFRLHRAYLAAYGMPPDFLARLPDRILEAELHLKGGSRRPDSVLAALAVELATAARTNPASAR